MTREHFGADTTLYHKSFYNIRGQLFDTRLSSVNDPWDWNRGRLILYYSSNHLWGQSGTDNNGNVRFAETWIPPANAVLDQAQSLNEQSYSYDALNRLSSVTEQRMDAVGGWVWQQQFRQAYGYDRYGNRTIDPGQTWGTGINNKQFDVEPTTNRLKVPSGQAGVLTYDFAGNLITDTYTGAGAREFDAENRMTRAWGGTNQWQSYTYNAARQRTRRKVNDQETWQIYGMDGELLAEYAANGAAANPQKEYGYRSGQLLIIASSSQRQWLVADHLGTPRMVIDQTGSLANMKRHDYLPFGEELFAGIGGRTAAQGYSTGDDVRQQFTSKERDNETNLDYFLARYYSSTQGRFTSPDPLNASGRLQEPQSWNRYSYVLNRPLALIDPNGMHDCTPQTPCVKTTEADAEAQTRANPSLALIQESVTLIIPPADPIVTSSIDPSAVSLNFNDLTQPVLMNQTAPSNLELASPDYYQLEINIAIPNKLTLTAVGVSLTGTLDRYGNIYGGIGPSVGKSLTGVSGAGTANYIIDGPIRTVRNEDGVASFLSGHSVTGGGGFFTGGHGTWVPGNGFAIGTGFYTPQVGAAYNYSWQLGNPFRAVGLFPPRTK